MYYNKTTKMYVVFFFFAFTLSVRKMPPLQAQIDGAAPDIDQTGLVIEFASVKLISASKLDSPGTRRCNTPPAGYNSPHSQDRSR